MVHVFTYLEPAFLRALIAAGGCCCPAAPHQAAALLRAAFPRLACYELSEWVAECAAPSAGRFSAATDPVSPHTLRLLRVAGAPMDCTALEACARVGSGPAVAALLAAGVDAAKGVVWQTAPCPLEAAVGNGHLDVARMLLRAGAPVTYHALRVAGSDKARALLATHPRAAMR
jgi:hypothetical protein